MISPTECQAGWWIRPGIFKSFLTNGQRSLLFFLPSSLPNPEIIHYQKTVEME